MKRRSFILKGSAVAAVGLAGGAAIAQTIPAVPRTSPSIFDFGARGNGLSDDSWAFATALQVAANEGRKVFVPAYTYSIADTIRFSSTANVRANGGCIARARSCSPRSRSATT